MALDLEDVLSNLKPCRRVITTLRREFPHLTWVWTFPMWRASDGSFVRACAALAPRYDGDDNTFVTEYWMYFPDHRTPKRLYL